MPDKIRNVVSVVAGFAAWSALWVGGNSALASAMPDSFRSDGSTDHAGILLGILALSIGLSIGSGYLCARIARRSTPAIVSLGILLLAVGIAVQAGYWSVMPLWYHLTFLGALVPGVLIGGLSAR